MNTEEAVKLAIEAERKRIIAIVAKWIEPDGWMGKSGRTILVEAIIKSIEESSR